MADNLSEIISPETIQRLWDAGFTVQYRAHQRRIDPFYVDPTTMPPRRAYQWIPSSRREEYQQIGWSMVDHHRHAGAFAPFGTSGPIEVFDLTLMEDLTLMDKDAFHSAADVDYAAAKRNSEEWYQRQREQGFTGSASTVDRDKFTDRDVETVTTVETHIPRDMVQHVGAIMRERDKLVAAHIKALSSRPDAETKSAFTQRAIDMVRQRLRGPQVVSSTDDEPEKGTDNHGTQQANDPGPPAAAGGSGTDAPSSAGDDPSVTGEGSSSD